MQRIVFGVRYPVQANRLGSVTAPLPLSGIALTMHEIDSSLTGFRRSPIARRALGNLLGIAVLLALAALSFPAFAQDWQPTEEQNQTVMRLAYDYLSAKDGRNYERAYALMAPAMKGMRPFAEFSTRSDAFNNTAGAVKERKIKKISWYKSPPAQAPFPGIYAAVDLVSRFENIDRHCGFLVLYQESSGQFLVMREEENYMDHDTERGIREKSSQADVEKAWDQLSRFCP